MLSYPLNERQKFGAPEESRTPKIWLLRPTRIPIPSPGQINTYMIIPYSKQSTVDILYRLFSNEEYKSHSSYCQPAEFILSTIPKINPSKKDEFVLTTYGANSKS